MRSRHNLFTLIAFPVLFVALTFALIYHLILPIVRPYVELAGLFISNSPKSSAPQNLLASAPVPPPPGGDGSGNGSANAGGEEQAFTSSAGGTGMIPLSAIIMPGSGDLYGWLTIEGTAVDAPVYWDDSPQELNAGIGTYTGGWLPGFGRTIMLAGHRNSWLEDLKSAEIGGVITVETHYGTYTYEITDIAVHHMDDTGSYDFSRKDENIIIYTCYPFDYIGLAKERYFVYGKPLTGFQIDRTS